MRVTYTTQQAIDDAAYLQTIAHAIAVTDWRSRPDLEQAILRALLAAYFLVVEREA